MFKLPCIRHFVLLAWMLRPLLMGHILKHKRWRTRRPRTWPRTCSVWPRLWPPVQCKGAVLIQTALPKVRSQRCRDLSFPRELGLFLSAWLVVMWGLLISVLEYVICRLPMPMELISLVHHPVACVNFGDTHPLKKWAAVGGGFPARQWCIDM